MSRAIVAAAIVALAAREAAADRLEVQVTEIAGGLAYIDHGRKAGLVRGSRIRFGPNELVVVEVTETTAVVEIGGAPLAAGTTGVADVQPGLATAVKVLPKPRPPEAFVEQWPAPVAPAADQTPKIVPLGAGRPPGRAHVTVVGHGFAAAGRQGIDYQAEARVIAAFDVMADRPLAADLDVAGRAYRAGANAAERVPVFVRAAQLRYGDAGDPRLALGRLRYAAASLGMLDGARVSARGSRFELAAFGGLVPDPISGKPDTGASRFGGEAIFDDPAHPWQPRIAVTGHASTWDGRLDERRLTLAASANHAALWLDGWAEAQVFASDNPWGARAVELTGAGATAQWRRRGSHLGGDITFLRPERSLRLAAVLPPEWLCTGRPQPGAVNEACTGGDSWASASLTAGTRGPWWSVDAIGAVGRSNGIAVDYDSSGYLGGELRSGPRRLIASISGGRSGFASWTAAQLGGGLALSRRIDVAARYRPELLDYRAATEVMVLHSAVVDLHLVASSQLDAVVSAVGTVGAQNDAVAVLVTLAWRPLP